MLEVNFLYIFEDILGNQLTWKVVQKVFIKREFSRNDLRCNQYVLNTQKKKVRISYVWDISKIYQTTIRFRKCK